MKRHEGVPSQEHDISRRPVPAVAAGLQRGVCSELQGHACAAQDGDLHLVGEQLQWCVPLPDLVTLQFRGHACNSWEVHCAMHASYDVTCLLESSAFSNLSSSHWVGSAQNREL
jgi:hypothetical protein